jgi:hypothetical protein
LKLPKTWRIHPVFHADLLSKYRENEVHGKTPPPPVPELVQGEEEYEVEAIVTHKYDRGKIRYLVKWEGYPSSENTWEPESHLKRSKELLDVYKRWHAL